MTGADVEGEEKEKKIRRNCLILTTQLGLSVDGVLNFLTESSTKVSEDYQIAKNGSDDESIADFLRSEAIFEPSVTSKIDRLVRVVSVIKDMTSSSLGPEETREVLLLGMVSITPPRDGLRHLPLIYFIRTNAPSFELSQVYAKRGLSGLTCEALAYVRFHCWHSTLKVKKTPPKKKRKLSFMSIGLRRFFLQAGGFSKLR